MPPPARFSYAFALGTNVALVSLNNVENHLGSQNRRVSGGPLFPVAIVSPLLDLYPVRETTLDGGERGDGIVNHEWTLTLCTYGLKYYLDTYFASGASVQVNMTIYTRRHEFDTYTRYNCKALLPSRIAGDIELIQGDRLYRVRQRFNDLELSS